MDEDNESLQSQLNDAIESKDEIESENEKFRQRIVELEEKLEYHRSQVFDTSMRIDFCEIILHIIARDFNNNGITETRIIVLSAFHCPLCTFRLCSVRFTLLTLHCTLYNVRYNFLCLF